MLPNLFGAPLLVVGNPFLSSTIYESPEDANLGQAWRLATPSYMEVLGGFPSPIDDVKVGQVATRPLSSTVFAKVEGVLGQPQFCGRLGERGHQPVVG